MTNHPHSVVQRQHWLMKNESLSKAQAYDKARKEFYALRHQEDIERRIAKEEAMALGAYFGKGPLEIGMELEDQKFEDWREWATKEAALVKQQQTSIGPIDENDLSEDDPSTQAGLDEIADSVPGSKSGQTALGGAPVHP